MTSTVTHFLTVRERERDRELEGREETYAMTYLHVWQEPILSLIPSLASRQPLTEEVLCGILYNSRLVT
jgi:hypothetical protein